MPLHSTPGFPVSIVAGLLPGLRVDALTSERALTVLLAVIETVQSHDCAHNVLFFGDGGGDVSAIVYVSPFPLCIIVTLWQVLPRQGCRRERRGQRQRRGR
jgi:hypothetical protein